MGHISQKPWSSVQCVGPSKLLPWKSSVTDLCPSLHWLPVHQRLVILSRLDYCNATLAGLPLTTLRPFQRTQNGAVRLVFNTRSRDPDYMRDLVTLTATSYRNLVSELSLVNVPWPAARHSLPAYRQTIANTKTYSFKRQLKTNLYTKAFLVSVYDIST